MEKQPKYFFKILIIFNTIKSIIIKYELKNKTARDQTRIHKEKKLNAKFNKFIIKLLNLIEYFLKIKTFCF